MKKIRVITLGCSKNTVDTEHLCALLNPSEFSLIKDPGERVDVLLINTCGFIGDAKEESIQAILEAVSLKEKGLASAVAVFGCLSQRYGEELKKEIPEVDAWFGARDLAPVANWLGAGTPSGHSRVLCDPSLPYAFLKISEGCDRRCSYCAIPHIRGPHRSVPMETLEAEARELALRGVKELVVIAQDSTYYGLDLYRKRALAELLERLSEVPGIERLRIHYSYPDDFPLDVLSVMRENPKVCRYLDIPLQHISDSVLRNMHRNVTSEWTRELVSRMRSEVPGVALRTTMIVGHPGETEKEFTELLDFVRESSFERLGAFKYSEEDGTWGALHLENSVPEEEKQRRYDALMSLQADISLGYNRKRIGSTVDVLADSWTDGVLVCRSEFESPEVDGEILVKGDRELVGSFFPVRITAADEYDLIGEKV